MRVLKFCILLLACLAIIVPSVYAAEISLGCGTVSGTIRAWRAKIKTKGPKNDKTAVVFLERADDKAHPLVDKLAVMDQKGLVFIPHILSVRTGTTVEFRNSDNEKHNVYFLFDKTGEQLDIGTWGRGQSVRHRFDTPGVVITLCKLHLEMAAYVIVMDNPYYTEAIIDGETRRASYTIENVPPGKYILKVWHKKYKMKGKYAEIIVESGKTTKLNAVITKAKYAK